MSSGMRGGRIRCPERSLLFTEVAHHPPVRLRYRKPFTVSWSNVDVDGAEVIVFLMTWYPAPRHLHVQLDCVHTQDGVTHVTEQVAG